MSVVQLADVPESERQFELIDGKKVWLPLRSIRASRLVVEIGFALHQFIDHHDLGEMIYFMLYRLPLPRDVCRLPGVSFVSYHRWPKERPIDPRAESWEVAPDLAVDVLGPDDYAEEVFERVNDYLQAGVRLVWIVYPKNRSVQICESNKNMNIITSPDTLDGGTVLPGFSLPLATLFPEHDEPAA